MQTIFPVDLHAGQNIASPSSAIATPFMRPFELAAMTFPPALVGAPSVIVYRFIDSPHLLVCVRPDRLSSDS